MTDDPVIKEYKVFITGQLASYVHLFQLPSRSTMPSSHGGVLAGRYKKECHHFELDVPVDTKHQTYSKDRGADFASSSQSGSIKIVGTAQGLGGNNPALLDKVTLTGGPVDNLNAKYFVGKVHDDQLHLTPLQSVIQLRPSLNYLDDIDAKNKAANKKITELERSASSANQSSESALRAIQVQFRKKETEEQIAARINSYAYQKRQVDEEPWISISHFSSDSQEAERVAERLVSEKTDTSIEFKSVTPRDYLEEFFK